MTTTRRKQLFTVMRLALASAAFAACGGDDEQEAEPAPPPVEAQPSTEHQVADAGVDGGHDAGPPRPPARLFAKRFVSKVRVRPDRESFRIGYLRAGAVVMATTGNPVRTDDPRCRGGWYELTTGGFVCNGRDVIAFWGRRLPQVQPAQPDRSALLPYRYGRNRRDNTPMYRRLPTDEEAAQFEGFHIPGQEPAPVAEGGEASAEGTVGSREGSASQAGETAVSARPAETSGNPPTQPSQPTSPAPASQATASQATASQAAERVAPTEGSSGEGDEAAEEEDVVTLDSLRGDPDSALLRRLVRGFIVSLDRDFRAGHYNRRYWRTINNGFVPYASMGNVTAPEFQGVRLDDVRRLPIGYILARNDAFYTRAPNGRARRGRPLDFHHQLQIVGEEEIAGTTYYAGADDRLYRERDVRRIAPSPRPDEVGPHEKWIEVDLSNQYLIAYEGDQPVYVTLISSGRAYHPDDPDSDFLTPTGTFRIRAKHLAATMDGDTAADGPYSIDDVPFVMYFQLAYALHGAFWHNAFGYPRSHGCVNLAPRDAQWIFNWSDPQLPRGWHGVYPTESEPGTLIWIHGETPGSRS